MNIAYLNGNLPTTGASVNINTGVTGVKGVLVSVWDDQLDAYVAWGWQEASSTSNWQKGKYSQNPPANDTLTIEVGPNYQGNAYRALVFWN